MPHVERAIEEIRRRAQEKGATARRTSKVPVEPKRSAGLPEPEVVSQPELLELATRVELNPIVLSENRVRGIQSSEAGEAAYKMLRTRVLQRLRSHGWQKLAVTSPRANSGKTLTSINLAISLAHEPNQDVILVDLDLRSPRLVSYLGLTPKYGLTDHLKRGVPLEDVMLKPTNMRRLYVVPTIEKLEHSSELLASMQMRTFTQTLAATSPSTIVIFDTPPLLEADDMLAFVPQVDSILFVVAQGETRRKDLEQSNELFQDLNLLGTVLNKSGDDAPSGYY